MALKLRRAEEKVVIQYCTRAVSFKRVLGSADSYRKCNTASNEKGDLAIP
jgi:hypothetical protein